MGAQVFLQFAPGAGRVKAEIVIVAWFIASSNAMLITCASGTFMARFAGVVETTVGFGGSDVCPEHPAVTPVAKSVRIQKVRSSSLFIKFFCSYSWRRSGKVTSWRWCENLNLNLELQNGSRGRESVHNRRQSGVEVFSAGERGCAAS